MQTHSLNGKHIRRAFVLFFVLSFLILLTSSVSAAKAGFVTKQGATYYVDETGKYHSGWLTVKQDKYYFSPTTHKMVKGFKTIMKLKYYFDTDGKLVKGFKKIGDNSYYFNDTTGEMFIGWKKDSKGRKRLFASDGKMVAGWHTDEKGMVRYFYSTTGYMKTGWFKTKAGKYYMNPSTGIRTTGTVKIDGVSYKFNSKGLLVSETVPKVTSGKKTIKNLLLAALQPIGSTLYVYGGGHDADATRTGLNPLWKKSYASKTFKYGLDCSGYIGWTVYQVMKKNATDVSGTMPSMYKTKGWGTVTSLKKTKKFYPGDILAHEDHIWMVLGQCLDGSVVILHSTDEGGPQIAGTGGKAVTLAKKYMKKYSGYSKYHYSIYCENFLSSSSTHYSTTKVFRFNSSTLSDPDGFLNKNASQILSALSSSIGDLS